MTAVVDQVFDVTARKFHQTVCVLLLIVGFVLGAQVAPLLVALVGAVLFAGRFWWQADIFRQLVWRVLEPAGILRRHDLQEDHQTRRVARVLGGVILLGSAALIAGSASWAWVFVAAIGVMISLDAAFDFCALCAITHQFNKVQAAR